MTEYGLYVESGPKHKHTMVHVFDLLGCIAQGPTTEAALVSTPDAIGDFLRLLKRHGDKVDPRAPFTTAVREHVTKGGFIGQGNPPDGFAPDFEPVDSAEFKMLARRLGWLREDFGALIAGLSAEQLTGKPPRGRPLSAIIEHVSDSSATYLRYLVGPVEGLAAACKAVRENPGDVAALTQRWDLDTARWGAVTDAERALQVPHGEQTWTARRGIRRALEHEWEHFVEMRARLGA